jgi:hypothetical protein
VLGYCLSQHNVELASFMDPNEVLVEENSWEMGSISSLYILV